jgi:hypothetical protein
MSRDYILDARSCVGNWALWWGPESKGYVCCLLDAGLYTLKAASSHRETDIPVHRSIARRMVSYHVRWEKLHEVGVGIYEAQRGKRPKVRLPENHRSAKLPDGYVVYTCPDCNGDGESRICNGKCMRCLSTGGLLVDPLEER